MEGKGPDENVVFIGSKPVMSYVLAVVTQFRKGSREVRIRARGNAISRAVGVAEVARARFVPDARPAEVRISSEELESRMGGRSLVPAIEIRLVRTGSPGEKG